MRFHHARLFYLCIILGAALTVFDGLHVRGARAMGTILQEFQTSSSLTNIPNELLVFDLNRPITTADRGFPRNDPPRAEANGDWTQPINFADGTLHIRVEVHSQPQPQAMRLQFCIWQDSFKLESCAPLNDVSGTAGTVVTWSKPVAELWMKGNTPIDWTRPRQRYAFAIKNSNNKPVSDYNGWNWNGENPNHWYPLDARLTVVVVAKDQIFSGWQNYIDGLPTPTETATAQPTATATAIIVTPPTATSTATTTSSPSPTATPGAIPPTATPTATATNSAGQTVTPPPTTPATSTPVATTPPDMIDAYEPNDNCGAAQRISTDATQQNHTLHQPNDIDWIRFDGVAGTNYRIRIITTDNISAELFLHCDDNRTSFSASSATVPESRIDFRAPTSGAIFIRAEHQDPSRSGGTARYALAVRQLETDNTLGTTIFLPVVIR